MFRLYISSSYYSSTGYTVHAYHSRITYMHVIVTLVIQLMLTIVYLRIYNSLLFSIALLYRTMLYTRIHTRMSLDYLSSSTIYRTMQTLHAYVSRPLVFIDSVPCRLCMLTYSDHRSHIYTQASTLASPLTYNYPSHYSSGLFYDNLY